MFEDVRFLKTSEKPLDEKGALFSRIWNLNPK